MSGRQTSKLRDHLASLGFAGQAGLLAGIQLLLWLLAAPLAYQLSGPSGVLAATVAAAVCLVGVEAALALAALLNQHSAAAYSLAFSMLARTFLPLLLGVVLHLAVPDLARAGMIYYLLAYYLVMLATETALTLANLPPPATTSRKAL